MTINHYGWRYYVQWQTITTSQNKTQDTQRVKDHGSMRLVTIRSSSLDLKLWPLLAGSKWPTTTWWWSSLVIHPGKRSKFSSDRHLAAVSTWTAVAPSKLIDLRTAISRQNWTWMDHGWSYKGHKNTKVRKETNCSLNIWSQKLRMGLSWKNCHPFAKNRGILLRGHCLISCWPLIHCDVQDMFVQVHWSLSLCKRFHVLLVIPIADVFLPLVILFVSHPQHEIIDFDWLPWPKTLWFPGPPCGP